MKMRSSPEEVAGVNAAVVAAAIVVAEPVLSCG